MALAIWYVNHYASLPNTGRGGKANLSVHGIDKTRTQGYDCRRFSASPAFRQCQIHTQAQLYRALEKIAQKTGAKVIFEERKTAGHEFRRHAKGSVLPRGALGHGSRSNRMDGASAHGLEPSGAPDLSTGGGIGDPPGTPGTAPGSQIGAVWRRAKRNPGLRHPDERGVSANANLVHQS